MLGIGTLTSCNDKLELTNPNQPTTVHLRKLLSKTWRRQCIACYHHIRMEGTALILAYKDYSTLDGLYASNKEEGDADGLAQYDRVMDQVEADFAEALSLLPSRDAGGEWAKGRATKGAAAGFYARALMQRHKYSEALTVLKAIIGGTYGHL